MIFQQQKAKLRPYSPYHGYTRTLILVAADFPQTTSKNQDKHDFFMVLFIFLINFRLFLTNKSLQCMGIGHESQPTHATLSHVEPLQHLHRPYSLAKLLQWFPHAPGVSAEHPFGPSSRTLVTDPGGPQVEVGTASLGPEHQLA